MIYNHHEISVNSYIIPKTLKIDVFGKNIIYAYLLVKLLLLGKKKICLLMDELVNSTTYHALLGRFSLIMDMKPIDNAGKNYIGEYDLPVLSLFREVIGRCVRNEGRGTEEEWMGAEPPIPKGWAGEWRRYPLYPFQNNSFLKTIPLSFPMVSLFIPIYPDNY